ncbi:MAG: aminotransferase class V-fold PLP-dependent enzyme [Candidatus Eremiobacteraeota bacterium]|nr:aminotransferase class V-fold PLP-dependent enzyme [Candidatus Eremiobacteraeota bacterium]
MNGDRFPAVMAAAAHGRILADNAACAQLPDKALERVQRYLAYDNAQQGPVFARARATTDLVEEAKREFAALVAAPPDQVGLGLNATSLAFAFSRLVASGIARGNRIVVTAADHDSNIVPWLWLRRFGAQVDVVPVDAKGDIDEAKFADFLQREPMVVALPWASNATGTVFDVARLATLAKRARATVVVDGVQALPHFALDIDASIDFAFFSGYKAYAPHLGFWYASEHALRRFVYAGDALVPGSDARYWTLETGTQSYEALAGWLGTAAYLRDVAATPRLALEVVARHELELASYARTKFHERDAHVRLYGRPAESARLPIFAFNVRGITSDELAARFEFANIEARVGNFNAPRLMQALAPDTGGRAVRLSFAHYNTRSDIDRCFDVIDAALDAPSDVALEPEFEGDARSNHVAEAYDGERRTSAR